MGAMMKYNLVLGALIAVFCFYAESASANGPTGCGSPRATTPDYMVGTWTPRQRDDGYDWVNIAPHVFAPGGVFTERTTEYGTQTGRWCVVDNVLIWGFDATTRTTYRIPLGSNPMRGFMSWDGGGTGEVEIVRTN